MRYEILIERDAGKSLAKVAPKARQRIVSAIRSLASNPRPPGAKKLTGRPAWRIRIGDYRVIYEILDEKLLVIVIDPTPPYFAVSAR